MLAMLTPDRTPSGQTSPEPPDSVSIDEAVARISERLDVALRRALTGLIEACASGHIKSYCIADAGRGQEVTRMLIDPPCWQASYIPGEDPTWIQSGFLHIPDFAEPLPIRVSKSDL